MLGSYSKILSILIVLSMCGCHYTKKLGLVSVWSPKISEPKNYEQLLEKGFRCLEEGKLESAESYFLGALDCDAHNEVILNNLGRIYFEQSKFYLAATSFQKALDVSETPQVHHNNLGQVWEAAKKFEKAELEYRQAIELDPGEIEYKSHLARVLRRKGNTDLETDTLLQEVSKYDDRDGWRDWANLELVKIQEENIRNSKSEINSSENFEVAPDDLQNSQEIRADDKKTMSKRKQIPSGPIPSIQKPIPSDFSPLVPIPNKGIGKQDESEPK